MNIYDAKRDKKRKAVDISIPSVSAPACPAEGCAVKADASPRTVIIRIDGMMCSHCEASVKAALEALPGVVSAAASHEKGEAEVVLSEEVPESAMREAVEAEDYTVLSFEQKN